MTRRKRLILLLAIAAAVGTVFARIPDFSDSANPGTDPRPDPSTIDYDVRESLSLADDVP